MKKYLTLILFLVSCGPTQHSIHKEFVDYVERFAKEFGSSPDIPITFSNLNGYAGVCIKYPNGQSEIEVDYVFWEQADDLTREELIFHELGHCILNRDHDEALMEAEGYAYNIPNSIMYPYVFGHMDFYKSFHEHYVDELFNPEKEL